jgi:hypothetical protein
MTTAAARAIPTTRTASRAEACRLMAAAKVAEAKGNKVLGQACRDEAYYWACTAQRMVD